MNNNSTYFKVSKVISIIVGVILCFTIIGIIFAVPLFIAASKFSEWTYLSDDELLSHKDSIIIWSILCSALAFPIGLISLVPVFNLNSQNIHAQYGSNTNKNNTSKAEKIKEFYELKEKGIITQEEFEEAKSKIINE